MSSTLVQDSYPPLSDLTIVAGGVTDASGAPLTNVTGACKVTIYQGGRTGTLLRNSVAMTYTGTPGEFTYTEPAAGLIPNIMLFVETQAYNSAGTVLHTTRAMELTPDW